jgi:hypothetical protein
LEERRFELLKGATAPFYDLANRRYRPLSHSSLLTRMFPSTTTFSRVKETHTGHTGHKSLPSLAKGEKGGVSS